MKNSRRILPGKFLRSETKALRKYRDGGKIAISFLSFVILLISVPAGLQADELILKNGLKISDVLVYIGGLSRSGGAYILSVRIVDVETGRVDIAASETFLKVTEMQATVAAVSRKMAGLSKRGSRSPYVWRSLVFPGWGQRYDGSYSKSYIFMGSGILMLGNLIRSNKTLKVARAEYTGALILPAGQDAGSDTLISNRILNDGKEERYARAARRWNVAMGVLTAFWLYNVFDAWIFSAPSPEPFKIRHASREFSWHLVLGDDSARRVITPGKISESGGRSAALQLALRF